MKNLRAAFLILLPVAALALADSVDDSFMKFSGRYWIYGGSLGDSTEPTPKDKKIGIAVHGRMAKDIFDAIGPDVHDICTEGNGTRIREKDHGSLSCSRSDKGRYQCNFGFDLRTGKSIGGIIC